MEEPIWRYQPLPQLLHLLHHKALYFARGDTLGDPFEGSYTKADFDLSIPHPDRPTKRIAAAIRQLVALSCWHLNAVESAGMWSLYGRSNIAIAVRSSTRRLIEAVSGSSEPVYLGLVEYVDYDTTPIPDSNALLRLFHKRRSFAHEHELRAAVTFTPPEPTVGLLRLREGVLVPVDVGTLIEAIYIAPEAPAWLTDVVQRTVSAIGFPALPIRQSRLGEEPLL